MNILTCFWQTEWWNTKSPWCVEEILNYGLHKSSWINVNWIKTRYFKCMLESGLAKICKNKDLIPNMTFLNIITIANNWQRRIRWSIVWRYWWIISWKGLEQRWNIRLSWRLLIPQNIVIIKWSSFKCRFNKRSGTIILFYRSHNKIFFFKWALDI